MAAILVQVSDANMLKLKKEVLRIHEQALRHPSPDARNKKFAALSREHGSNTPEYHAAVKKYLAQFKQKSVSVTSLAAKAVADLAESL